MTLRSLTRFHLAEKKIQGLERYNNFSEVIQLFRKRWGWEEGTDLNQDLLIPNPLSLW